MRKISALTGLLLITLPLGAGTALAAAAIPSPYRMMQVVTQREFLLNDDGTNDTTTTPDIEPVIRKFVAAVATTPSKPDDVNNALRGDGHQPCIDHKLDQAGGCDAYLAELTSLVKREEDIRTLGRDLQIIASSYETTINTIGNSQINVPLRAQSIQSIWRASSGSSVAASSNVSLDQLPPASTNAMQKVTAALQPLLGTDEREGFVAAVWRYQFGVRYANRVRKDLTYPPEQKPADNPELQYLVLHWPDLEAALTEVYGSVPDPDTLEKGSIRIYQLTDEQQKLLDPYNISVWVYKEKLASGDITGDAGLTWTLPIEPVLPALCEPDKNGVPKTDCTPLPGGNYPPPLADGRGLCTLPFGRLGYLCRDILKPDSNEICTDTPAPDPFKIQLAACTSKAKETQTYSGPNVCNGNGWLQNPAGSSLTSPFNPQTQCKVSLGCGCAQPTVKLADGTIPVCINQQLAGQKPILLPPRYAAIRDLTYAQELCTLPPGTKLIDGPAQKQNADCCRIRHEAYTATCQYASGDRAFVKSTKNPDGTTTDVLQSVSGVPLNTQLCADLLTDYSCRTEGMGRCASTFSYQLDNTRLEIAAKTVVGILFDGAKGKDGAVELCKDTLNRSDVVAKKQATEQLGRGVCDPNRISIYSNTIGNNMCYIGSCVEESLEHSRVVAGRSPMTTGDEAFPWDACSVPRADGGQIRTISPKVQTQFGEYRPALLIQQLDTALCQANGLPPSTPPVLCGFDVQRRLLLPLNNPLETAFSLLNQQNEYDAAAFNIQTMGRAVGTRIGTSLYDNYLRHSVTSLSDITVSAAKLLEAFSGVNFTRTMCPLNGAEDDALIAGPHCQELPPVK